MKYYIRNLIIYFFKMNLFLFTVIFSATLLNFVFSIEPVSDFDLQSSTGNWIQVIKLKSPVSKLN